MDDIVPVLTLPVNAARAIQFITTQFEKGPWNINRIIDLPSHTFSYGQVCPHSRQCPCTCELHLLIVSLLSRNIFAILLHTHQSRTEVFAMNISEVQEALGSLGHPQPGINANILSTPQAAAI